MRRGACLCLSLRLHTTSKSCTRRADRGNTRYLGVRRLASIGKPTLTYQKSKWYWLNESIIYRLVWIECARQFWGGELTTSVNGQ
jgi:hypothetical protein